MPSLPVRHVRWLTPDIYELALERRYVRFAAGDLVTLDAGGESRPYSIASGVDEAVLRFLIRRLPGGVVSEGLAAREPGQAVLASDPYGYFRPLGDGAPGVFIGTGTGIAPILSVLRSDPDATPFRVLYGVRQVEDAVSYDELSARGPTTLAVSRESVDGHHHGRVTDLLPSLDAPRDTHYYLCGLDAMIEDVTDWLEDHGVDPGQIHREVFFHA